MSSFNSTSTNTSSQSQPSASVQQQQQQQPRKIFVVPQSKSSLAGAQTTNTYELTAKNQIKIIPININSSNAISLGTNKSLLTNITTSVSKKVNIPIVSNQLVSGQLSSSNTTNNTRQMQVVKIINSNVSSSSLHVSPQSNSIPIFNVAKIQTIATNPSIIENSTKTVNGKDNNQMDSLRLHTYQLTKPVKGTLPSQTLFVNKNQSNHVIHKITSTSTFQQQQQPTITKTTASNLVNYQVVQNNENSNKNGQNAKSVENDAAIKKFCNFLHTDYDTKIPKVQSSNMSTNLTAPSSVKLKLTNDLTSNTNLSNNHNNNSNSYNRKPCNCTKSMCLKLYCDCFAMGSFCHNCNCINCSNTLEHEDERNKAIKMVLDRNPNAFQSKIGKFTFTSSSIPTTTLTSTPTPVPSTSVIVPEQVNVDKIDDEIQSRHIKGCNCKKSNCLKRYCECYLAKIQCSNLCKCVGCKNCDESTKSLLQLANAADLRKQQMTLSYNKFAQFDDDFLTSNSRGLLLHNKSYSFVKTEVAEAVCSCLIAQAEESGIEKCADDEIEALVLEEFGRCLVEIIKTAEESTKK